MTWLKNFHGQCFSSGPAHWLRKIQIYLTTACQVALLTFSLFSASLYSFYSFCLGKLIWVLTHRYMLSIRLYLQLVTRKLASQILWYPFRLQHWCIWHRAAIGSDQICSPRLRNCMRLSGKYSSTSSSWTKKVLLNMKRPSLKHLIKMAWIFLTVVLKCTITQQLCQVISAECRQDCVTGTPKQSSLIVTTTLWILQECMLLLLTRPSSLSSEQCSSKFMSFSQDSQSDGRRWPRSLHMHSKN